jgi:hypothetical protein
VSKGVSAIPDSSVGADLYKIRSQEFPLKNVPQFPSHRPTHRIEPQSIECDEKFLQISMRAPDVFPVDSQE